MNLFVSPLIVKLVADWVEGSGVSVHHLSPGVVITDMVHHQMTPASEAKFRKVLNILADPVETIAPWLAARVLAGARNGARVDWLTKRKVLWRFATAALRKRDLFAG